MSINEMYQEILASFNQNHKLLDGSSINKALLGTEENKNELTLIFELNLWLSFSWVWSY